jgi:hypothetical protein
MQYRPDSAQEIRFDMLALTRGQIRLARYGSLLGMLVIVFLPCSLIPRLWPGGVFGLDSLIVSVLLSAALWIGGGILLLALFRGAAMASPWQQRELQQLFAEFPELHAYRDRVSALGRGFTVGEHETLMAWPAMKASIADDLDSEA